MYILTKGKQDFLDHLRNITPQVVLLYGAIFIGKKLIAPNLSAVAIEILIAFIILIVVFFIAYILSLNVLITKMLAYYKDIGNEAGSKKRGFKNSILQVVEVVALSLLLQASLIAAIIRAMN